MIPFKPIKKQALTTLLNWVVFCILILTSAAATATHLDPVSHHNWPKRAQSAVGLVADLESRGVQVHPRRHLKVVIRADNLFRFPSNAHLKRSGHLVLDQVTQLLHLYGDRRILISGHTDHVGTDRSKLKRSYEQAETVAAYLWAQGIPLKNMRTIGCGDTHPVASDLTLAGNAANRRIEIETL